MDKFLSLLTSSLFSRLVLIFVVTLILLLAVIYSSFRIIITSSFQRGVGPYFSHYVELVRQELTDEPDLIRIESVAMGLPLDIRIEGPSVNWSTQPEIPLLSQLDLVAMGRDDTWTAEWLDRYYIVIRRNEHSMILSSHYDPNDDSSNYVLVFTLAAILLILFLSYRAVQWLIQPIAWVKDGAERIGKGELQHRIPSHRHDELGELSHVINEMAEDIEKMLEAKRQLLLSISHELRSPITRTKVSLEFVEDEKVRKNLAQDVMEMEELINDLLESEKLNARHSTLNSSMVSINELVDETILDQFPDKQDRLELILSDQDISINLDPVRIKLLIKNIVTNALRHSSSTSKKIKIEVTRIKENIQLLVEDEGEGIAKEHLARVTEPFYRADPSRQRQTGGYGLGLYLCQLITQAHNGSMDIESELGLGTRITISLPITDTSQI